MEYELIIDKEQQEKLILIVHEKNELVTSIENLLNIQKTNLIGYKDYDIVKIDISNISCVYTDNNKVYVLQNNVKYLVKQRLFQIEEMLDTSFIKINQGCIINMKEIKKFELSIGGSVKVILKCGFEDYISRRELQKVKRRLGI